MNRRNLPANATPIMRAYSVLRSIAAVVLIVLINASPSAAQQPRSEPGTSGAAGAAASAGARGATRAKEPPAALPGRMLAGGWRELTWDDLMPPDWDPLKIFEGRGVEALSDGDPRAEALMRELREQWDQAPTRPELDGLKIRLPGYVVPLDMLGGDVREFLLVPYMGACIHTPPPPANQIIHALATRRHALQTMDAIWINGTLRVARSDTNMGVSAYRLDVHSIEPYRAPKR